MNEVTTSQNELGEVDNLYRRLSTLDSRRPGEWVRRKVHAYAAQQAAERSLRESSKGRESAAPVAPTPAPAPRAAPVAAPAKRAEAKTWLLPVVFGAVVVVALVGFLVVPSLMAPRPSPSVASLPPPLPPPAETTRPVENASTPSSDDTEPPEPPLPTSQSSESTVADSPAPAAASVAQSSLTSPAGGAVASDSPASAPPTAPSSTAASSHGQAAAKTRVARQAPPPAPRVPPTNIQHADATIQAPPSAAVVANNSTVSVQTPPPPAPTPAPPVAAPVVTQAASTPVPAPAAPVSNTPPDGFWRAAEIGDLAQVRSVIASNADLNALDPKGRRALIMAIEHSQITVVKELLAHGANPKLPDAHGKTPQNTAYARGNFEIMKALERSLKQ